MRVRLRNEASQLLLAVVLFGAGAAAAQDYPDSIETAALTAWLGKSTNIAPATVVSVTPELVVAIAGKTMPTTAGGPVRLTLREEVIAPGYVQTVGGRSSLMSMEIHCDERRVRMDERRLYSGLNLTGAVEVSDPSAEWVRIPEGSIMDEVARATCDPEYSWPLGAGFPAPASGMTVAALETPVLLPPGPDAKPVEDEPPIEENVTVAPPVLPEPEVVPQPETAVAAPAEMETTVAPVESISAPAAPVEIMAPVEAEPAVEPPPAPEPDPVEIATDPPEAMPAPVETPPAQVQPAISEPPSPAEAEIATPAAPNPAFAVQIGAYETRQAAQEAWTALSAARPILADGLGFEIRPVRVKGKDWLRGLVGRFATRRDAAAFCTAIAGGEYGCIVRTLAD